MTPVVTSIANFMTKMANAWSTLTPGMQRLIIILAAIAAAAGPVLVILGAIASGVGVIMGPVGLVIAGVAVLIAAFMRFRNVIIPVIQEVWNRIKPALMDIWRQLQQLWQIVAPVLTPVLKAMAFVIGGVIVGAIIAAVNIIQVLVSVVTTIAKVFRGAFTAARTVVLSVGGAIVAMVTRIKEAIDDALNALSELTGGNRAADQINRAAAPSLVASMRARGFSDAKIAEFFKNEGLPVPALASGGIVTRPTLALIGERGPEAVVPLGSGSGGGGTYAITITNWDSGQAIMRRVSDQAMADAAARGRKR
jgi:hypothetical protein